MTTGLKLRMALQSNQSGMSLIEVVLVLGLMSFLTMVIAKLMGDVANLQGNVNKRDDYSRMLVELNATWSDRAKCQETFAGVAIGVGGADFVVADPERSRLQNVNLAGRRIGGTPVADYRPSDAVDLASVDFKVIGEYPPAGSGLYRARAYVNVTSGGERTNIRPRDILINLRLAGGVISECVTSSLGLGFAPPLTPPIDWMLMPPGSTCGAYVRGVGTPAAPGIQPCQGHNPRVSCPPGFRRYGGDYQSPGNRWWYTCLKL